MSLVQVDLTMGAPAASGSIFALSRPYTILNAATSEPADIYEDSDGSTPADNPITSTNGELRFYIEEGELYHRVDSVTGLIRPFFPIGPGAYDPGSGGDGDAVSIHGVPIAVPGPDEDGMTWVYDDATGAMVWTELPAGGGSDPVEAQQDLTDYMNMSNWMDYDSGLLFYQDRERVYFEGVAYAQTAGNSVLATGLPVGYRPTTRNVFASLHTSYDSTVAATRGHWWEVLINFAGQISFRQNSSFSGSPNFGYPPFETVFDLATLNFRVN